MKIFALLFAVLALISSAVAFKDPLCGLEYAKNGRSGRRCRAALPSWSYKAETNECLFFVYGGCNGSGNRFGTVEECEDLCKE